jgi:RNA-directed DNA polymerase
MDELPQPIPKAGWIGVQFDGCVPTVLDRFIQQAVMQVLQRRWNPRFSHYSYGFRPRRSAHHAVAQAQQYIAQGYGWVIDLDLEKFFDRVNHDKLMGQIAKRVEDKPLSMSESAGIDSFFWSERCRSPIPSTCVPE